MCSLNETLFRRSHVLAVVVPFGASQPGRGRMRLKRALSLHSTAQRYVRRAAMCFAVS